MERNSALAHFSTTHVPVGSKQKVAARAAKIALPSGRSSKLDDSTPTTVGRRIHKFESNENNRSESDYSVHSEGATGSVTDELRAARAVYNLLGVSDPWQVQVQYYAVLLLNPLCLPLHIAFRVRILLGLLLRCFAGLTPSILVPASHKCAQSLSKGL